MDQKSYSLHYSDTDRPVYEVEEDELGFIPLAEKLAPVFVDALETDGMVIGLEGPWGSGKTSLANYLIRSIPEASQRPVSVINLAPWLNGDSDSLVSALLRSMRTALTPPKVKRTWWEVAIGKEPPSTDSRVSALFSQYAARTSRVAVPLLKLGGVVVPGLSAAGDMMQAGSEVLDSLNQAPTNSDLKIKVVEAIASADCRFLVVLDDLDRLEPDQAVEVIRLVRSVADFPKTLYLLCYDRQVLARALETGLKVNDGDLFLQKIVQQTFSVPLPEPFDLRLSLIQKAVEFYKEFHRRPPTAQETDQIRTAINEWGEQLRTPREVKLVFNSIKFSYPPVSADVHYPDICRLHLIKILRPPLYRWLEQYLAEYSVIISNDGSVSRKDMVRFSDSLKETLDIDPEHLSTMHSNFMDLVPGISLITKAREDLFVFREVSRKTLRSLSKGLRLGSPYHYRFYFALSGPKTVLSDQDITAVSQAIEQESAAVVEALWNLYRRPRSVGGSWLGHYFARLEHELPEPMTDSQLGTIIRGTIDLMDLVMSQEGDFPSFNTSLADQAVKLVGQLQRAFSKQNPARAKEIILGAMADSPAINWIVGDFFRQELHNHGTTGYRKTPESEWAIPSEYYEDAIAIVKARAAERLAEGSLEQLPDLGGFLYGCKNLDLLEGVKKWLSSYIEEDKNLISFLQRMRTIAMSDHVYYPLRLEAITDFLDIDIIEERLKEIVGDRKSVV